MSTSRKRSKGSKGKKTGPSPSHGSSSSRSSLASKRSSSGGIGAATGDAGEKDGDSNPSREMMAGLIPEEADKPGDSGQEESKENTGGGGGGGGGAGGGAGGGRGKVGKSKGASADRDRDRLVYFDPAIILPPADKRSAPGGETAEEQRRYNNRWMFTPATVLSAVDPEPGVVLIRTKDSEVHRARGTELETVNPQALEGVPDAMSVSNLTQASLLHTVRERYNRDEVYTRVGPVLMSVNPYKWIVGLYAEEAMLSYHGKAAMIEAGEQQIAPHLFGVADHAYSELVKGHLEAESETKEDVRKRKARASNQSIIISGESGSGKTEATKIIMQYLARITSASGDSILGESDNSIRKTPQLSDVGRDSRAASSAIMVNVGDLEARVLSCNPLLESFGNAVTLKNDNSSRFGKFIKIQFDKKGRIRGAQIQNYLLEKTRIVAQAKRERSYHIFYQLLSGASSTMKKDLKLEKGVAGFQCLKGSSIKEEDAPDFQHTMECLAKIGVKAVSDGDGEHGQDAIFTLIAAIMHLLNVGFKSVHVNEGEACEIHEKTRPSLVFAAELLGVEAEDLEKAAVSKTMAVHSTNTMMLQTVEQAHDKVAALGKALYSQLFLWLVAKLNTTISAPQSDVWGFIGVLDIYGFEKFNTNSLEQLLINYANEHLQRHFNQHMFEVEQVDYDKEQIDWSYITFNDNKACLELIDGKGGLFSCLDDIQRFEGKEANLKFLSSFKQKHGPPASGGGGLRGSLAKSGSAYGAIASPVTRRNALAHPHFVSPRFDPDISFGIKHYAGDVFYSVAKFNQKNRENLTADMKDLMAQSTNDLVVDVFKAGEQEEDDKDDDEDAFEAPSRGRGGAGGRTIRSKSIGIQFKESLAELMSTISITHPRYIRCVKPNPDKQSSRFDGEDVLLQLQYSGTMETIRIRQQGYALRELKDDFLKKYKVLHPDAEDLESLVAYLSNMLGASHRDWQIGTSKVFLRTSMSDKLNVMVDLRRKCASRVIQRWAVNNRRRTIVRSTLEPFLRKALVIIKYRRAAAYFRNLLERRRAATSIVRWYRLSRDRKRFTSMRKAEKVVKALLRVKYFVTQLSIRKEFSSMTLFDVDAAIEDLETQEKTLKAKKDFLACLPVASRLHHLRIVAKAMKEKDERRKQLAAAGNGKGGGGGKDGGFARQEIEVRLMEAQWRMADAEADQDFSLCTRLQRDIKGLESQRELNPTLAELKEKEQHTRAEIDAAAADANYARAGTLQAQLVSMEEKIKAIEEDVEAEKQKATLRDLSQQEIEDKMSATRDELESAKAAKEFAKCIDLQARLSQLQATSDAMPTLEQVEREVLSAEAEMAAAKAKKDYRRAAELSLKLPAMHDRHSAIASAIRKAMNRKQLAEEVKRLEGEMRLAKAEKRFSQCSLLQRSLEELWTITEGLPTVQELEEEISDVRFKMDAAVSERSYAEAEQFRVRLTELAEEKALAAEKEQHQYSGTSPLDTVAKARHRLSASPKDNASSSDRSLPAAGDGLLDSRDFGVPPPPPPPVDTGSVDSSFVSPKAVRVKQTPGILSPVRATPAAARVASVRPQSVSVVKNSDDVTVARLRPKAPVTMPERTTVTDVCRTLARARSDAALLTGSDGGMTGIVTAIDFIRRVVAVGVDPDDTAASDVMTPNPTTVLTEDSAMEALSIMLGRHFRHLPVRSSRGDVTGVLDIAKCLYDAVSRLQRTAKRRSVDSGDANEAEMSMLAELGKGKGKKSKAAMQALLAKMFEDEPDGGSGVNLSLAELLRLKGEPQLVFATDSARGAGKAIARGRKAVLVVDNGGLAGIFTEKDMLNRVLSKGINPDSVSVAEVMTPNPDTVPSTMTILEALQEMHENKYLHLPVVDESDGNVLGVVGVMEIIQATAGEEGSTGWKALFGSGLESAGDGFSDTSSHTSLGSINTRASTRVTVGKTSPRVAAGGPGISAHPSVASSVKGREEKPKKADSRPVSVLKPKPPLCLSSSLSMREVAKKMADVRTDAVILLDSHGQLEGILSDHDVARRLMANKLDPSTTPVSEVMTPHPTLVRMTDSAMDCLGIMIEKRFRHLPVIDGEGNVTGLLNIAKCLYDAIHRLKKKASRVGDAEGGDTNLAASVLQVAGKKGKGRAKDLKAALAMLLSNTSEGEDADPTLREILSDQTTSFVDGRESVTAAAVAIAKGKKAVLVLNDGRMAGIVTPKDLLMRVLAKDLNPDETPVSDIMTPNPDTVTPEMTAVEALGEMHENKYLHLPVVDADASMVVGVVNVMEILQATAGAKGSARWEAFFGSAMDAGDDVSDSASMYSVDRSVMSVRQRGASAAIPTPAPAEESVKDEEHHRPVSSLKPKPPLCLSVDLTVAQVAKRMAEVRTDAVILLGQQGDMKGIVTDHDVAKKVVGQSLDPRLTPVSSIMMPDPIWVTTTDSAMDALETMLETHSRHLPVVSEEGAVSGLLNIAKCLYDAIHRLEKKAAKAEAEGAGIADEKQELAASLLKIHAKKGGKKNGKNTLAAMTMLLEGLADGEEEPTLEDILSEQTGEFAQEGDSVAAAGKAMSRSKKAVVVLRDKRLAGIITPKDLLMRVVAKGLDPDETTVSSVMTPNPDAVPPTMTVIEALREMHENRYLHLPVVDESSGKVLGVVSVMEIIEATAGDKGSDRWEAFFGDAMDAADDVSDSASMYSAEERMSLRSAKPGGGGAAAAEAAAPRSDKKVAALRPKRPVVMPSDGSVLEVATEMSLKRTDAALLTKRGRVVGIVTDHDLTRRVIALDKHPDRTPVRDVMTADPAMVSMDESAMEALGLMLQNKTRHLPVMDTQGKIGGLLDIAKCLYDAVNRLGKAAKKKAAEEDAADDGGSTVMIGAVLEAAKAMKGKASAQNQKALQELMMLAMAGSDEEREGANQTLGDVLASKEKPEFVRPRHTVREAASVIAAQKKAVLVVEEGELVGIFTPKDMMNRVITKRLNPGTTAVSSVMTPNPDGGGPDMTVIEALQQMCENRYLHLPVVAEGSGEVLGVVDVMEIIQATVGQEGSSGWEAFFGSAMDAADDLSDTMSETSLISKRSLHSMRQAGTPQRGVGMGPPPSIGKRPGSVRGSARGGDEAAMSDVSRDVGGLLEGWDEKFVYKVNDDDGNLYKFKASAERLDSVLAAVADKLKMPKDAILLKYQDDDGDQVVLSGDDNLLDAVDMARASSKPSLLLLASLKLHTLDEDDESHAEGSAATTMGKALLSGSHTTTIGIAAVAVVSVIAIFMSRGGKK